MKFILFSLVLISLYGCGDKNNSGSLSQQKTDSLQTVYTSVAEVDKRQILSANQGSFFYPRFSSNGSQVYLTSNGQKGIYVYNIKENKLKTITDDPGAGYNFVVMQEGSSIAYRRDSFSSRRRKSEIALADTSGTSPKIIFNEAVNLSSPIKINEELFAFTAGNQLKVYSINKSDFIDPAIVEEPILYTDGDSYAISIKGQKKAFAPFGKGSYVWASLSPGKNSIVFNYMGKGTFITDLEGKTIAQFAYAGAPQWSPDGNWIAYMTEENDGHVITRAEIFVSSSDGKTTFQITSTEDVVELYPSWSADGKNLIYGTDKGDVFVSELNFK